MVESQLERSEKLVSEPAQRVEQVLATAEKPHPLEQLQNALKDIYFVSGLGADERVFRLLKFEGYQPVHIRWLDPEPGEPIERYAKRLTAQIKSDRPIIVALSFGGMIAVEIAKQIEVEKVILVSSVKDQFEVPPYFRMFRWLPIHRIFPFKSLLWIEYWFAYWFFSLETIDERKMLRAILLDSDAHFIKWAVHKVVTWKNETIPDNLYHIHGLNDRIFPIYFVQPDFTLTKSGHFMIMNRAIQVSELIQKIIS